MSSCEAYLELISASLDGMLSPEEQSRLDAHLAACPDCRALMADLRAVREGLIDLPDREPPAALKDDIMAAVAAQAAPAQRRHFGRGWQKWMAAAAVIGLAVLGVWRLGTALPRPTTTGGQTAAKAPADGVDAAMPENGMVTASADGTARTGHFSDASDVDAAAPEDAESISENAPPEQPGTGGAVQPRLFSADPAPDAGAAPVKDTDVNSSTPKTAVSCDAAPTAAVTGGTVPENAPEPPVVTAAPEIALTGASVPQNAPEPPVATAVPTVDQVVAPRMLMTTSLAADRPSAAPAPLTPAQALDRLLEEKGFTGFDRTDDTTVLWPREGDAQESISCVGLSDSGAYHLFEHSRLVFDPSGSAHTSRLTLYAVPLDGGDIIEGTDETFWAQLGQ